MGEFLVVRLGHSHKFRCQEWVESYDKEAEIVMNGKDVLVFATSAAWQLRRAALADKMHIGRVLNGCSVTEKKVSRIDLAATLTAIYDRVATTSATKVPPVAKLSARGDRHKEIKKVLLEELPAHIDLAPRNESLVLVVEIVGDHYFVGAEADDKNFYFLNPDKVVSRAYYKMRECCGRWRDIESAVASGKTVLDVGAAPGGWTQFALERGATVIAVDPASLDVDNHKNLVHLRCRMEDADIEGHTFDAVICDANCHPNQAYRALKRIFQAPFLRPGSSVFLLTLKQPNTTQKIAASHDDQEDLMANLENSGFIDIRVAWLWANSRRERTLAARWQGTTTTTS